MILSMSLILQITQDSAMDLQESNSVKEEKKTKKKPLFYLYQRNRVRRGVVLSVFPIGSFVYDQSRGRES